MRENLLKNNTIVLDKVTNEKFLVRNVTAEGFTILPVTDEEIYLLNDEELDLEDFCTEKSGNFVNRMDLILYQFVKDVQPAVIPDCNQYRIDPNGFIISEAGKRLTEQGLRFFKSVLGAIPNGLVLVDKDDNLVVYNLRKDRFKTVFSPNMEETQEISYIRIDQTSDLPNSSVQKSYFAAYANMYDITEEDGESGEKIKVKNFVESYIFKEVDGFMHCSGFPNSMIISAIRDIDDNLIVHRTGTDPMSEVSSIYLPDGSIIFYDGRAVSLKKANGFVTVRESDGFQVIETGEKYFDVKIDIPELDGFYAFEKDYDGNLFFVNEDRIIKKLVAKQTSDRGKVHTVEDVN